MKQLKFIFGLAIFLLLIDISFIHGAVCSDLTTELISYYTFDADCQTDDFASYDGTNNGASNVAGFSGNGCDFSTNDYIAFGDNDAFSFTDGAGTDSAFSICMFTNFDINNQWYGTWGKADVAGSAEWTLQQRGDGLLGFNLYSGANPSIYIQAKYAFVVNNWQYFCAVYNGSEDTTGIKIFLNGSTTGLSTGSAGSYAGMSNTATQLTGGAYTNGAGVISMDGTLDEVGLWNCELTQAQVQSIFDGTTYTNPLVGGVTASVTLSTSMINNSKYGLIAFPGERYLANFTGTPSNTGDLFNCSLFDGSYGGVPEQSWTDINITENHLINVSFKSTEDQFKFMINCTNNNASDILDQFYWVYLDGINPEIQDNNEINNSIFYLNYSLSTFYLDVDYSDTNLFFANATIINSTGSVMFSYFNNSINGSSPVNLLQGIGQSTAWNWSGNPFYYIKSVADDHTKKKIKPDDYHVNYLDNGFDIDDLKVYGETITYSLVYYDENQEDRFKFKIKFEDDAFQHSFYIEDSGSVKYLPYSNYMGHFVLTKNSRWLDLVSPDIKSVDVIQLNDSAFYVTVNLYKQMDEIEVESIGDLNFVEEISQFNISDSFYFYSVDAFTNATIQNFTVTVTNGSWTQSVNSTNGVAVINITSGSYETNITATDYVTNSSTVVYSEGGSLTYNLVSDKSLYFLIYDEKTNQLINDRNVTIDVINFENTSSTYTTDTGSKFISGFATGDYEIRYIANAYNPRTYYATVETQTTQSIRLYLLNTTDASYVAFSIEDETGNVLENATVSMTRFFVDCNCYRVVEMDKANFQGEAVFSLEKYDTRYNFIVSYLGVVVYSSTAGYKITEDSYTLPVTLLGDTTQSYFGINRDVFSQLSYNNATKLVTFTVSDSTNLVDHFCIYVDQMNALSDIGYLRVCENCLTATTGSVTCNISTYYDQGREIIARGFIETNTTYSSYWTDVLSVVTDTTGKVVTGTVGVFLSLLIAFTVSMIGFSIGGLQLAILGLDLGIVVSRIVGLLDLSLAGIFAIIGVSFLIIYLIGERS